MVNEPELKRVKRLDSVPLEKVEYTQEGFLIDTPIVTSVGVFEYHEADGSVRRELRLPEHVFAEESLASYEGKPVILTHDAGRVSKDNVADEIVGTILTKGYQDGDDVRCKIVIHNIDEVKQSGLRELSLGYDQELDETPGEWEGQPYDAIQTGIVINHLAIVREARAGEQARLNIDSKTKNTLQKGANEMSRKSNTTTNSDEMRKKIAAFDKRRKRRLDEAEAEETKKEDNAENPENADDESEVANEIKDNNNASQLDEPSVEERVGMVKDRRDRRDADGDANDLEAAKATIAEQDEDIEQLIEIIEELQAVSDITAADNETSENEDEDEGEKEDSEEGEKPMNADSVDAVVAERLKLGRIGDRLNLDGLETLKPIDAKKRVIKAIKPDLRLDGKSKHYINTAFDIAVQELNSRKTTEHQRRQMFNADGRNLASHGKSKSQRARENMLSRLQNGGK